MTNLQYLVSGLEQPSFSSDDSISSWDDSIREEYVASPLKSIESDSVKSDAGKNTAPYRARLSDDIRQPSIHNKTQTQSKLTSVASTSRETLGKSASGILSFLNSALKAGYYAFLGAWQGLLGGAIVGTVYGASLPDELIGDYLPDVIAYPLAAVTATAGFSLGSVAGVVAGTALGAYNGATNGPKEPFNIEELLNAHSTNQW